jgi:hypothetical protein
MTRHAAVAVRAASSASPSPNAAWGGGDEVVDVLGGAGSLRELGVPLGVAEPHPLSVVVGEGAGRRSP